MNRVFGEKLIDEFKAKEQSMYHQLMNNYKSTSKRTFYADVQEQRQSHSISVPRNFIEFLIQQYRGGISSANMNAVDIMDLSDDEDVDDDKEDIEYVREYLKDKSKELYGNDDMIILQTHQYSTYSLEFKNQIWFDMFDVVIDPLIEHVRKILEDEVMRNTNYIFLVGGLASSRYYQQRMKDVFHTKPYSIKVVVPQLPVECLSASICPSPLCSECTATVRG